MSAEGPKFFAADASRAEDIRAFEKEDYAYLKAASRDTLRSLGNIPVFNTPDRAQTLVNTMNKLRAGVISRLNVSSPEAAIPILLVAKNDAHSFGDKYLCGSMVRLMQNAIKNDEADSVVTEDDIKRARESVHVSPPFTHKPGGSEEAGFQSLCTLEADIKAYSKCRALVMAHVTPVTSLVDGADADLQLVTNERIGELPTFPDADSFFGDASTSYSSHFRLPEDKTNMRTAIESRLSGQVIVDVGAGALGNTLWSLNAMPNVKGYIAVEPHNMSHLIVNIAHQILNNQLHLPFALVQADGLDALKMLPDNSVSVITSGLEIIRDKDYVAALKGEIGRVASRDGAWLIGSANFDVTSVDIEKIKTEVFDLH